MFKKKKIKWIYNEKLKKFIPFNPEELSLRDYFAGQALAGMGEYLMQNRDNLTSIAKSCYSIADAMLEVRK